MNYPEPEYYFGLLPPGRVSMRVVRSEYVIGHLRIFLAPFGTHRNIRFRALGCFTLGCEAEIPSPLTYLMGFLYTT